MKCRGASVVAIASGAQVGCERVAKSRLVELKRRLCYQNNIFPTRDPLQISQYTPPKFIPLSSFRTAELDFLSGLALF